MNANHRRIVKKALPEGFRLDTRKKHIWLRDPSGKPVAFLPLGQGRPNPAHDRNLLRDLRRAGLAI